MTLPASGTISLNQVNTELSRTATANINMNDSAVRSLAQVGASGTVISMSNLRGKASYTPMTVNASGDAKVGGATGSSFTATCRPTASASFGSGGYTYSWSFTFNPQSFTLANPTLSSPSVSHTVGAGGYSGSCTLQVVVTDNTAHQVTIGSITCSLDYS